MNVVSSIQGSVQNEESAGPGSIHDTLMWCPDPNVIAGHRLEKIRLEINDRFGEKLRDYADLHKWSIENYDLFWGYLWEYFGILHSRPSLNVIDKGVPMNKIPQWFEGALLNYAENLLRYPDDEKIAIYYTTERRLDIGTRTFGQLRKNVANIAAALRHLGVVKGDRVVGYLPNCPLAIETMAATSSIGAIWSSTSPDFGVSGVLDRFHQIKPKVIFSVEAVSYNMKIHDHLLKLREVVNGLSDCLEKVIVFPFCFQESEIKIFPDKKEIFFDEFLDLAHADPEKDVLKFEQLPFNTPLFIMYSSGTTGKPKCIVHGAGGTLMKHLEEHQIQGNRGSNDVLLYYTTVGWMMWNWMVTSLSLGTTIVLYDGSPLHPHAGVLWDLVDECKISVFGTSAKWIAVQEDRGIKPRLTHNLSSLKTICSTGSPLKPHSFDYVYRDIKTNVLLASISGGTDIIACFMGENSIYPVHRGQIQSAHLGCAMECWDEDGTPFAKGETGDLVCTKPFPSMPVCFWNDDSGELYHSAYFEKFDGVWAHGDFFKIDPITYGMEMLGRSDGTLNPNGVRFGSAEIYNIVEPFREVGDSLCVGQKSPIDGEERVILFLKMADNQEFTETLANRIRAQIRTTLSARHVPALVLPISDIPYTVNGKKVEVAIKQILAELPVKNQGALANPLSLELYKNIPETKVW